jgi:hypothetical protein
MATTAKRSRAKTTARKKTAVKTGTKKTTAKPRRSVTGKARQPSAAPKRQQPSASARSDKRTSSGSSGSVSAAKKRKLAAPAKTAHTTRKPAPAKKTHRRMSAQEKKNLVAKHLRELLEEKKRRAAQTPAWQQIVHHDRPAPLPAPQVPEAAEVAPLGEMGPPATVRGGRDRGGD